MSIPQLTRSKAFNLGNGTSPAMNSGALNQLVANAAANALNQPIVSASNAAPASPSSSQESKSDNQMNDL